MGGEKRASQGVPGTRVHTGPEYHARLHECAGLPVSWTGAALSDCFVAYKRDYMFTRNPPKRT